MHYIANVLARKAKGIELRYSILLLWDLVHGMAGSKEWASEVLNAFYKLNGHPYKRLFRDLLMREGEMGVDFSTGIRFIFNIFIYGSSS